MNGASDCDATKLVGEWTIERVSVNDSVCFMPDEMLPDVRQYVKFGDDGTLYVGTNCNGGSGTYSVNGDSLVIDEMGWTEMACDNMVMEDMMKQVLLVVRGYEIEGDTVLRLNTDADGCCVVLRRQ